MCFTRRGLELAEVTVVDMDGNVVYDTLVRPDAEIIDQNTRFSGITAKDLSRASKRLRGMQMDLISFVHAETILIGHALDYDLRALRILHSTVIDT
ncbi:putative exonuclease GOR [Halictus rubicundus]|uniref:putative exonuclease GOR n=1 Tax=Halictus rubicundus TaxID=77578 RepID=UPI004035CBAB